MKSQLQSSIQNTSNLKLIIPALIACSVVLTSTTRAYSDSNSFFGTNASGVSNSTSTGSSSSSSSSTDYSKDLPEDSNPNAVLPGLNDTAPNTNPKAMGADFTGDEKRMQKKYKANINNAKNLIEKGTQMMDSAGKNISSAVYKKGKILKEIGEKSLAELKANNPFAGQKDK